MAMDDAFEDDLILIGLVAQAQPEALNKLYERYHRLVYSLALAIVADPATAEEITLDVFVRVWQRAATYHAEKAKVSTWLTAITRHHAIDILRRQNARPDSQSLSWDDLPAPAESAVSDLEDRAELSLRRERVRAAVAQLPDDQQRVLALAYFNGYTHQEIANALQQPLGTVKTRLRLAMQKLRQILLEEQPASDKSEPALTAYRIDEDP
jgi:RNA polymerase sigma-70 factor (ECF subfamily)